MRDVGGSKYLRRVHRRLGIVEIGVLDGNRDNDRDFLLLRTSPTRLVNVDALYLLAAPRNPHSVLEGFRIDLVETRRVVVLAEVGDDVSLNQLVGIVLRDLGRDLAFVAVDDRLEI